MMLDALLAQVPTHATSKTAVVTRLIDPVRQYHNLDHVLEMWEWHNRLSAGLEIDPHVIASFCLYHDSVYDPRAKHGDNEQFSADMWMEDSGHLPQIIRNEVDSIILASADHFLNRCVKHVLPCQHCWCLDLDLLRLGAPYWQFSRHGEHLREEYAHLPPLEWVSKSAQFRAKVMGQATIYVHSEFAAFEEQARHNLAKALTQDWFTLGYLHDSVFHSGHPL